MKAVFFVSTLTFALSLLSSTAATSQYSPTQLAAPAVNAEAKNQAQIQAAEAANQRDARFQSRYGKAQRAPQQVAPAKPAVVPARPGVIVPPAAVAPVATPAPAQDARFQARYGNVSRGPRTAPTTQATAPGAVAAPSGVPAAVPVVVETTRKADPGLEDRIINFQRQNAISGNRSAQYDLGMRYLKGDGLEQDLKEARHWLQLAAKNGHTRAKKQLAQLDEELKKKGEKLDEREAKKPEKAAEADAKEVETATRK